MKFIRFSGTTPFLGTDYEDYIAVEDDTPEDYLTMQAKGYAIDNGRRYDHFIKEDMKKLSDTEKNFFYLEYLQKCLDAGQWEYVTEYDFDRAMDRFST